MKIQKTDIIKQAALATGQSQVATKETIEATIKIIQQAIVSGDTVSFLGFLSFIPVTIKEKQGKVNGLEYSKPEHNGVKLKSSKVFRDLIEAGIQDEK